MDTYKGAAPLFSRSAAIGVVPMDTVYSIVGRAKDQKSVERIFRLKQRIDNGKPGTLVAANIDQLIGLGFKRRYLEAVKQYWPGPVSVVIPCGDELSYLHLGMHSLAVRIPSYESLRQLLEEIGPIMTSSANRPGEPPANTIEEARRYFGDQVDFYIDGGDLSGRQSSTVIRMVDDAVEVLREGAVKIDEATGRVLE